MFLVAGLVLVLAVVPPVVGGFLPRALAGYLIFGLLALSVGLISGYGRLFNLGVGATFGISAYMVAAISQFGITNPFILLVCSIGAGMLVALLFAFYSLVSTGTEYLMLTFLTTLAFAVLPLAMPDLLGGDNGLAVKGGLEVSFGLNPSEAMSSTSWCWAWWYSAAWLPGSWSTRRPARRCRRSAATRSAPLRWGTASAATALR